MIRSPEHPIIDHESLAIEAVADAMMTVQARFFNQARGDIYEIMPEYLPLLEKTKVALQYASRGGCQSSSLFVIYYLQRNYPGFFTNLVLLDSVADDIQKFRNPEWSYHAYFLAGATDGTWYAGSPANYEHDGDKNPFTVLIRSDNLEGVLLAIRKTDGGHWPSVSFMERCLQEDYRKPKILEPEIRENNRKSHYMYFSRISSIDNQDLFTYQKKLVSLAEPAPYYD